MPRARLESFLVGHEALLARTPGLEVTPGIADEAHDVDFGLHLGVIGFMANPLLDRAYRQVHDHIRLVRLDQAYMYSAAAIARTMQEHIAIVRACLARDPDAAAAALEHHFAKAMQRALGL
jgi:DNA-binding GntR family transcriptional regulator